MRTTVVGCLAVAMAAMVFASCGDDSEASSSTTTTSSGLGGSAAAGGVAAGGTSNPGGAGGSGGGGAGGGGGGGLGGAGGEAGGGCGPFPPVVNQDWQASGAFATTKLITGPGDHFQVVQPTDLGQNGLHHPIIVWCVGTGASPDSYEVLLDRFASHGFVVIAGDDPNQTVGDQAIEGLEWLVAQNDEPSSQWADKLDVARIAVGGHSQGGNASIHAAIKSALVTAVLPVMPGIGTAGNAPEADESLLAVPVFYTCGGEDNLAPPFRCADRFADTLSPAWVGVQTAASHFAPNFDNDQSKEQRHWLIPWLRAQLMDDCEAYELFYGDPFALSVDADWEDVDRKNL